VKFKNFVTEGFKNPPNNPVPSDVQFYAHSPVVVRYDSQVVDDGPSFLELYTFYNFLIVGTRKRFVKLNLIDFLDIKRRVHEAIREITVIGQQKKTGSVSVEPTDGVNSLPYLWADQLHDRLPLLRIVGCRDVTFRFVKEDVHRFFCTQHTRLIAHNVSGIHFETQFGNHFSVNRDESHLD